MNISLIYLFFAINYHVFCIVCLNSQNAQLTETTASHSSSPTSSTQRIASESEVQSDQGTTQPKTEDG